MNFNINTLLLISGLFISTLFISGCSGQTTEKQHNSDNTVISNDDLTTDNSFNTFNNDENLPTDSDLDGIPDIEDQWPNDNSLPKKSTLWGVNGELWKPDSRLPFVALAGYQEGKTSLPTPSRIVANVLDFGATNTEGSPNDTQAFQDAIAHARTQVSASNVGVIYVPAGVYDVDEQLHLNVSGLILRGAGLEQSTIRFSTGLINDLNAIGSSAEDRKLIVMGGNYDENSTLKAGLNWQKYNNDYSAALDTENLPQRGDFSIKLSTPLNATLKQNIIEQGYRILLSQSMNYGESSTTPKLAEHIYGGPDFSTSGGNGGILVSQQFVVTISADDQTLTLDRPLRFTPTDETLYSGARIAVRDKTKSWETENIGVENLSIQLPATDWIHHFGTEGQGGIEIMSDNSWVKNIKIINADNGINVDKKTFNNTIQNVVISANRVPRRSGPALARYDAYGHHGISLKGRDHILKDFVLEVSYVHDVTMNNCHGCVVMRGEAQQMNMDHHRQAIYSSVWTELQLGNSQRMWTSTGDSQEGFNAAAYNTYWNLTSDTPELSYWPEDSTVTTNKPEWGYHVINVIGTDIKEIPLIGTGNRPYPYHPDNAHLEVIDQSELWPQNIYEAQRKAYLEGVLTGMSN